MNETLNILSIYLTNIVKDVWKVCRGEITEWVRTINSATIHAHSLWHALPINFKEDPTMFTGLFVGYKQEVLSDNDAFTFESLPFVPNSFHYLIFYDCILNGISEQREVSWLIKIREKKEILNLYSLLFPMLDLQLCRTVELKWYWKLFPIMT